MQVNHVAGWECAITALNRIIGIRIISENLTDLGKLHWYVSHLQHNMNQRKIS